MAELASNADYQAFIGRLRAAPFVEQKPEQGSPAIVES